MFAENRPHGAGPSDNLCKDIPVIMSGPMVRATLDGRKTVTRRLAWRGEKVGGRRKPSSWQQVKPAARLWVRETVACGACAPSAPSTWAPSFWRREQGTPENRNDLWYAADGLSPRSPITERGKWVPSIHMPRWASRLTLVVTATKIERLQDISEEDARAEGIFDFYSPGRMFGVKVEEGYAFCGLSARESFMSLLCDLHGPDAWNKNPEIVAVSFRVIKANIDAPEARIAAA
jgi:hypothetical protein